MELKNKQEVLNTRYKLKRLQALYDANERETGGNMELREIERESLQRLIDQMASEIAQFEARHAARS